MEAVLELSSVRKAFAGRSVLHGVDLALQAGETVALLGRNGSGKTTTIRIAAGLLRPDSGTARVAGLPVTRLRRTGIAVGYCPQENVLYPDLTVEENLLYAARLYGVPRHEESMALAWVLHRLSLRGLESVRAEDLSGGQKRRLTLAASAIHQPQLLLVEEPEAGVDPLSRVAVESFLRELGRTAAVLMTSHDPEMVRTLATRAAFLDQGVVCADGRPRDVLRRLKAAQVAADARPPRAPAAGHHAPRPAWRLPAAPPAPATPGTIGRGLPGALARWGQAARRLAGRPMPAPPPARAVAFELLRTRAPADAEVGA